MAVTTLKRKARRNSAKAEIKAQKLKLLNKKPVIKKVDIESLKKQAPAAKSSSEKKKISSEG